MIKGGKSNLKQSVDLNVVLERMKQQNLIQTRTMQECELRTLLSEDWKVSRVFVGE